MGIIQRLARVYPEEVLELLIYMTPLAVDQLGNREASQAWVDKLNEKLAVLNEASKTHRYSVHVEENKHAPPEQL